jgi:hypothetical protein
MFLPVSASSKLTATAQMRQYKAAVQEFDEYEPISMMYWDIDHVLRWIGSLSRHFHSDNKQQWQCSIRERCIDGCQLYFMNEKVALDCGFNAIQISVLLSRINDAK